MGNIHDMFFLNEIKNSKKYGSGCGVTKAFVIGSPKIKNVDYMTAGRLGIRFAENSTRESEPDGYRVASPVSLNKRNIGNKVCFVGKSLCY